MRCAALCLWILAVGEAQGEGALREAAQCTAPDGQAYVVGLFGGATDGAGVLRRAAVRISNAAGEVVWDAFDRALHPWLVRSGRFAGRDVVLIGVRRPAIFDPVERPRPFIYSLRPGGKGLVKVWLGTSLSRPFVSADFGNLDGEGEDELVALERTATGGLALGTYRWEGFGVEGIARSEPIPAAREMVCGDVWGDATEEAVVCAEVGKTWRFVAYGLRGEALEVEAKVAVTVGEARPRWGLVAREADQPGGVRVEGSKVNRIVKFRVMETGGRMRGQ